MQFADTILLRRTKAYSSVGSKEGHEVMCTSLIFSQNGLPAASGMIFLLKKPEAQTCPSAD
jgi:hypothetical protein